jgi:hypothetical protein
VLSQLAAVVERELLGTRSKAQVDLERSLEKIKELQQEVKELRQGKEAAETKFRDAEAKLRDAASDIGHLSGQLKKYGTHEVHLGIARNSAWKALRSRGLLGVVNEMNQLAGDMRIDARIPSLLEDLLPADYEDRAKLIGEYSFPEAGKEMDYKWSCAVQPGGIPLEFLDHLERRTEPFTGEDVGHLTAGDYEDWDKVPPAPKSLEIIAAEGPVVTPQDADGAGASSQDPEKTEGPIVVTPPLEPPSLGNSV